MNEFLQIVDIKLFIATALSIFANILIGSIDSGINNQFDKARLIKGLKKAGAVIVSIGIFTFVGYLVPDIKVIDQMTITDAMNLFTTAALIWYAGQGLIKIKNIVLPPTKVTVNTDTVTKTDTITETDDKITQVEKVEEKNVQNVDKV